MNTEEKILQAMIDMEARLNARMDGMESGMNARFDKMDERFESVYDRLGKMENDINAMRYDISGINLNVARIWTHLLAFDGKLKELQEM